MIRFGLCSFAKKCCYVFSEDAVGIFFPRIDHGSFDHLVQVVSVSFLHPEVTIFPFIIRND